MCLAHNAKHHDVRLPIIYALHSACCLQQNKILSILASAEISTNAILYLVRLVRRRRRRRRHRRCSVLLAKRHNLSCRIQFAGIACGAIRVAISRQPSII